MSLLICGTLAALRQIFHLSTCPNLPGHLCVREGFVPLIRQMPGFRSYYLLDGGPEVLITISRFDSADEALASNEKAADWVRHNVLQFTKGLPEVMVGNTLIAEVKQVARQDMSATDN